MLLFLKTCSCRNQEFTYLIVHDRRSPSFGKFRYRRGVCPQVRFAADQYDRLFWAMFSDFTWPLKKKKPRNYFTQWHKFKTHWVFSKIEWKKFHTHIKLSVRLFFLISLNVNMTSLIASLTLEMAWSMLSGSATEKQIIMRSASAYDRGRTLSYLWDPVTKRENKT